MTLLSEQQELERAFGALHIPRTHATVGLSNRLAAQRHVRSLLTNRRLPDAGWSEHEIQYFLFQLATLDTNAKSAVATTNNSSHNNNNSDAVRWCGVGEREGRVYSNLVAQRHFGFSHGVGRSGDITEPQPKAVGSSVLGKLTLLCALDAVRRGSGLDAAARHGILLPLCTGMSMSLVLSSLRNNSNNNNKNIVLWSRIDQKSCFKAVTTAGLTCVVVPTKRQGDSVGTDLEALQRALQEYTDRVLAVITTTSCFAPRVPDQVDRVAQLCREHNVPHLVNHAYGLQCATTCQRLNRACTVGRVDAIVCSTDKNFLVPVGGAIVLSPSESVVAGIGQLYAGRASAAPLVDLFITLLSMGLNGYRQLLAERQTLRQTFPARLQEVAARHGERVLDCPDNTISFGVTLDGLAPRPWQADSSNESETDYLRSVEKEISRFGAMLFSRCVSGTRVVPRGVTKTMGQQELFVGFGSSVDDYPHAYLTAACAIGVSPAEIDEFLLRLDKTLNEFKKKQRKT